MIPLVDMMRNLYEGQTQHYFDFNRNGFVVKANMDITWGSEINISVGDMDNYFFLTQRGYINRSAEFRIPITVVLSPEDPQYQQKVALLGGQGVGRQFCVGPNINTE